MAEFELNVSEEQCFKDSYILAKDHDKLKGLTTLDAFKDTKNIALINSLVPSLYVYNKELKTFVDIKSFFDIEYKTFIAYREVTAIRQVDTRIMNIIPTITHLVVSLLINTPVSLESMKDFTTETYREEKFYSSEKTKNQENYSKFMGKKELYELYIKTSEKVPCSSLIGGSNKTKHRKTKHRKTKHRKTKKTKKRPQKKSMRKRNKYN